MPTVEEMKTTLLAKINNADQTKAFQTMQFLLSAFINNAGTPAAGSEATLYAIIQALEARGL